MYRSPTPVTEGKTNVGATAVVIYIVFGVILTLLLLVGRYLSILATVMLPASFVMEIPVPAVSVPTVGKLPVSPIHSCPSIEGKGKLREV